MEKRNAIIIILDGLGDLPVPEFGGLTPLQAAKNPNLDRVAAAGACGLVLVAGGKAVESDLAHLILLGYDPVKDYPGRGPLEALGIGLELQPGDIAFRGNFARVDENGVILDRRGGRKIPEAKELASSLDGIAVEGHPGVTFRAMHSSEQRLACALRGPGLSSNVSMPNNVRTGVRASECVPLDGTPEAKKTATIVNAVVRKAHAILESHPANKERASSNQPPINALLLYGPGEARTVTSMKDLFHVDAACVAGNGLIKGVCKYVGMVVLPCDGATGTASTDLDAKVEAVARHYKDFDVTLLHVKATDSFGHDKCCEKKKAFIEAVDAAIGKLLGKIDLAKTFLFVTGDHATPCVVGNHTGDPVPIAMAGPTVIRDHVTEFDEANCAGGYLGRVEGKYLMAIVLNKLDKLRKFGA
ncbi:MAG: 2,3-bisphosphoglycerate-independent phosphoglycerate mutase [Candidatus Lokiarchaeota archaeon]|nr:2,3-bisphosphoglycerate-independent phosphoglycerate mutase [Candidatus Lokiarchaeota archaeon]